MTPDEPMDDPSESPATPDEVRCAIESLSEADSVQILKAARLCLSGSEYHDVWEIINEATRRTMNAAMGDRGRQWPKTVPFVAYMIQTMKGLASDSRDSLVQTKTDYLEALTVENGSSDDTLGRLEAWQTDVETQVIEHEETLEQIDRAKMDAEIIEQFFKDDSDVTWIIMGHKEGLSASEIREIGEMTQTKYETARKRLRRGVEKLFPGRRAP